MGTGGLSQHTMPSSKMARRALERSGRRGRESDIDIMRAGRGRCALRAASTSPCVASKCTTGVRSCRVRSEVPTQQQQLSRLKISSKRRG